jgi:hypothetical protein
MQALQEREKGEGGGRERERLCFKNWNNKNTFLLPYQGRQAVHYYDCRERLPIIKNLVL